MQRAKGVSFWSGHTLLRGMSLAEVLVVIAFIAIVAGISIPALVGVVKGTKQETAERNLNYLNGAVANFNDANWELVWPAASGSDDEKTIFDSLRYRDGTNPVPGSPYLPDNAAFQATSDSSEYRAQWNGRMFEIVYPGTNGTGLNLMNLMGSSNQPSPTNTPVPPSS